MKVKIKHPSELSVISADNLRIGVLAKIQDETSIFHGTLVLGIASGLVALDDPRFVWDEVEANYLKVQPLPSGSVVELLQE